MNRRVFALGMAASVTLRGETRAERGKKILAHLMEAVGGNAFQNMQSRVESGRAYSFYREQLKGLAIAKTYTRYVTPQGPGKVGQLQRQVYGKKEEDVVLFTLEDAFDISFRGAKPLREDRLRLSREATLRDVFYILRQRQHEPGLAVEGAGQDVTENQPVDILDIFDAENRKVTVYVHSSTGLPVKQRYERVDEITRERREEVTRFTKYRDIGNGVMWPYDIQRERDTEKLLEMYSENVKLNPPVPDSLFEVPRGIHILSRDKPFA